MKIYTRTGDKGTTCLYTGKRMAKDHDIFHALGAIDELSSLLGVCHEYSLQAANGLDNILVEIQCACQDMGSNIATPRNEGIEAKLLATVFDEDGNRVKQLEDTIDKLDEKLPLLTNFILPSGGVCASHLHLARSVCRRAERIVVGLCSDGICDNPVERYLNRLSDLLFVMARYAAQKGGKQEMIYRKCSGDIKRCLLAEKTPATLNGDPTNVKLLGLVLIAHVFVVLSKIL